MSDPRPDDLSAAGSQPDALSSDDASSDELGAGETQEDRAMRALQAIWGGADLTEEAMKLSNEYTDRHTAQFTTWLRRVVLRRNS